MAAGPPQSGAPIDPGAEAANRQAVAAASKGQAPAKSMDDLLIQILSGPVKWLSKAVGVKFDSFLETGIMPVKLEDGGMKFINNSMNVAAATLSAQGGAIAAAASLIISGEGRTAGIGSLPIEAQQAIASIRDLMPEGMPVSSLSYGELGTLSPPSMGAGRAESMGMTV
jgi:hypothetical protein